MTEYELTQLLMETFLGNSTPVIALYLTTITIYMTASWFIGTRLTRPQAWLLNTLLIVFSLWCALVWASRFQIAVQYQEKLMEINPDTIIFARTETGVAMVIILIVLTLAALKFMYDIRRDGPQEDQD
jgi:hypothetical protein